MKKRIISSSKYSIIGKRVPSFNAEKIARGEAQFVPDIHLPGMLYGATMQSPHPHARICSLNTSKAEALPGVKAVITGQDISNRKFCIVSGMFSGSEDKLPLEQEKVRFVGDEVAAVAAVDMETAAQALELIDVEYDLLPALFDPLESMKADSSKIHEKANNISTEIHFNFGDVVKGFEDSDYIFSDTFTTSQQAPSCMETHGCIAMWDNDGRLTLWSSTQAASTLQRELAKILGIPYGKVRVIKKNVGGSFGSKMSMHTIEPIAAYLAKKTKKPVQLVYDREEEFVLTRTRHPLIIELKTGVKQDGTIIARQAKIVMDNGAYNSQGPGVLHDVGALICSYYRVKNVKVDGFLIYTNKPWGGSCRGFGNPQTAFAIESQMDIIARKLEIDPLKIRLKNATETGDITACGWQISSCGLKGCLEKVSKEIDWHKRKSPVKNRGLGMAVCIHWGGGVKSGTSNFCRAVIRINGDQAQIFSGACEIGEGCDTVLTQIAAEELGLPINKIRFMPVDTYTCPSFLFVGSPTTYAAGGAVKAAAINAKRKILKAAAKMNQAKIGDLDIIDGYVCKKNGENIASVREVNDFSCQKMGNPIIGKGCFNQGPTQQDTKTGMGQLSPTYSFAAQGVEIEVDPETGVVKIEKVVSAHDSGKYLNPLLAEGQIEGGLAQGIGYALSEGLIFDENGKIKNSSFADYKILRAKDMPREINTIMIATEDCKGPFGAKALGEAVMVPTAAAIANAIEDATGIRIKELPMTPEKIINAMILNQNQTEKNQPII